VNLENTFIHQIKEIKKLDSFDLFMQEHVDFNYRMEDGNLVLFPFLVDIPDWSESYKREMCAKINNVAAGGGYIAAAFDNKKLIGIASLKNEKLAKNRLQLYTLHVDADYRKCGSGTALLHHIIDVARKQGANGLYISASPKERTVNFYLKKGAVLTDIIEPALFDEEPEDIHMELMWQQQEKS